MTPPTPKLPALKLTEEPIVRDRITVIRGVLLALGVAACVVGGVILLNDVNPKRYLNIAIWLAGAVILHDAVLAPILVAIGLGVLRVRRRVGRTASTVIQAALIVGALLSVVFGVPGILAQLRGAGNYTVATTPYALSLLGVWVVVLLVIAAALAVPRLRRARTK